MVSNIPASRIAFIRRDALAFGISNRRATSDTVNSRQSGEYSFKTEAAFCKTDISPHFVPYYGTHNPFNETKCLFSDSVNKKPRPSGARWME
jgi:hypothetical protein